MRPRSARLGDAQRQQAAQAVAEHDRRPRQTLRPGDDVVDIGGEVELAEIGRLGPVVAAQVERVTLPAARREIAQVALPQPRAAQLAVEHVQRLAPRAPLGQPRLDVQAAVADDALVLADRPRGAIGPVAWSPRPRDGRCSSRCRRCPSGERVEHEAGRGLGVEVGRLRRHELAGRGDGQRPGRRASGGGGTRRPRCPSLTAPRPRAASWVYDSRPSAVRPASLVPIIFVQGTRQHADVQPADQLPTLLPSTNCCARWRSTGSTDPPPRVHRPTTPACDDAAMAREQLVGARDGLGVDTCSRRASSRPLASATSVITRCHGARARPSECAL